MENVEQMQATIREHAEAIAEVRARVDVHEEKHEQQAAINERHEKHLGRLDEICATLRETIGRVATKDDIADLRKDVSDRFDLRARDAHNSIPVKLAAWFGGLMALIAFLDFAFGHFHG
jgi:uncharacterized membrane protein YccC